MNPNYELIEWEPERHELREGPAYLFRATRRDFLGTVGAGLLFLAIEPQEAAGQSSSSGSLQARLHLGADGRIRVLTGKIKEGQGARTELAMAAAEELRVPLDQVDVLMADTDVVPNDGITAGSRTTPSNVPVTRRAAAGARELLRQTAATQWKTKPDNVRVANGAASMNGRTLTYRELAQSAELQQAFQQPPPGNATLMAPAEWRVLGKPQHRPNGRDVVTGAHHYPADIQRPGMLYASILRPPGYGAKLKSVDLDAARKMPGVVAVRDGDFVGCAAPTSYAARKAVAALAATAQWKTQEHPSSDNLFSYLKEHAQQGGGGGRNRPMVHGDVAQALQAAPADARLKATYTAAYIQHAPMEPRSAVAEWQDGKLTVWTGTSNPFSVREQLAQAFQMPASKVRVIVPDFGGGFGGKHTGEAALEAARLAREAQKPVSLRWTRAEEFTWAYFRPAALIEVEAALGGNGKRSIQAWDFANYNSGGAAIDSPYKSANARIRYVPCEQPLRSGSYRALASTANNFARESFIDELAAAAGMDPLDFRLDHLDNDRIREVLLAAAKKFDWEQRRKQKPVANRGIGLACGTEKNSVVAACVEVEVDPKTGAPRLLEICQAYECGAILNPAGLQAQVEGCILMGLGAALREEIRFAGGKPTNARFSAYRVTRFRDVPKMEIVLVNKPDAEPVGAGETPIIAVAPAMANAIFLATGKRVRSIPFGSVTNPKA